MNWQTLYSSQRSAGRQHIKNPDTVRNSFIRDYDRLIFSSAFRRLQNKTQVFPLPGAVLVHNRLTHSLEVASVGRSLGKSVGEALAKIHHGAEDFNEFYRHELQHVIAAACLAHDIGNPPFGHSGEDAIRTFFSALEGNKKNIITDHLSENQLKDFTFFEGNANAFRVVTHPFSEAESSYRLTFTTLASIVKYPCKSLEGFDKESGLISRKKSGFFDSELKSYLQLTGIFNIPKVENYECVYVRHPFVYLTEAADDICYRVMDLEDAHRLNIIDLKTFQSLFLPFFEKEKSFNAPDNLIKKLDELKDDNQKVQYIRARWIGLMVGKLSNAFIQNEKELLNGTLQKDLLNCLNKEEQQLVKNINRFSHDKVYNYRSVLEVESAGFNVIGGLLKMFIEAALYPEDKKSEKLLLLIPAQFPITKKRETLYNDIQSVVDYISGMTDLYAVDIYRKLTGIAIPNIR